MNTGWRVGPRPGRGIAGVLRDRFWPFTMVVVVSTLLMCSFLVNTVSQFDSIYVNRFLPEADFVWHYVGLGSSFATVTLLFTLIY